MSSKPAGVFLRHVAAIFGVGAAQRGHPAAQLSAALDTAVKRHRLKRTGTTISLPDAP